MTKQDRLRLEHLLKFKEQDLHDYLLNYLSKRYNKLISTPDYIIATGDIPVCLVAHLDVVSMTPPSDVFYDSERSVLFCINGFGADDRNGVFAIMKILERGYRPHIIFTHGEEKGCIGASQLSFDYPISPFNCKYLIQLDRRGDDDCVFYDCANEKFNKYVESFGFKTSYGSFTDISIIAPTWGIAAVNLSVGYRQEHSQNEHTYTDSLIKTVVRVERMIKDIKNAEYYKYIKSEYSFNFYDYSEDYCDFCLKEHKFKDLRQIVLTTGEIGLICEPCAKKHSMVCLNCGELYEIDQNKKETLCPYCDGEGATYARISKYDSEFE